jgi:hypothetical protein
MSQNISDPVVVSSGPLPTQRYFCTLLHPLTLPSLTLLCRSSLEEARREDPETLTFGNSVYNVQFDTYKGPIYGHRYMFFLADAVEHVPEYVVDWDNFVR